MKIKRDGIYKTIDSKDFGIFQKSGWEKVVVESVVDVAFEPEITKEEVKVEEPIVEEQEPELIEEVEEEIIPKAKKKKKA